MYGFIFIQKNNNFCDIFAIILLLSEILGASELLLYYICKYYPMTLFQMVWSFQGFCQSNLFLKLVLYSYILVKMDQLFVIMRYKSASIDYYSGYYE